MDALGVGRPRDSEGEVATVAGTVLAEEAETATGAAVVGSTGVVVAVGAREAVAAAAAAAAAMEMA